MSAADVLTALKRHHSRAALVPEVSIRDEWADDREARNADGGRFFMRRIDVLMFSTLERTAIEIKVSRADAARDNWDKIAAWRNVTHRFVYAVPANLIDRPPVYGCGLWWVHDDGRIEVVHRAKANKTPEPLPQRTVQAIAYRAAGVPIISDPADTTRDQP